MKNIFIKIFVLIFLATFITSCNNENNLINNDKQMKSYKYEAWDVVAVMKTTNGTINILLETELTPITANNFIWLAKSWYYNWVIFHRIIKDFMIQWGDPMWTWMGGTSIYWEKFDDEINQNLKNNKYTISMANAWPNTNWSQFFINTNDNNFLDWKHAVFGEIVEWFENVDKIEKTKTDSSDRPEKEVKMISVEIKEYRDWSLKDYEFNLEDFLSKIEEDKKIAMEAKKDKAVEKWDLVFVHYTWTFENWEKFDSSLDRWTPIDFQVWAWDMIKWFDEAILWMKIWDKKTITLSPSEAYWEYDENNKQVIEKTELQSFVDAWIELKKWNELPTTSWVFKIIDDNETSITIDANHMLAWKTLIFDLELVDIK